MIHSFDIDKVFYTFQVGQQFHLAQQKALEVCQRYQVNLMLFDSESMFKAETLVNHQGKPYLVFTPFYKKCLSEMMHCKPLDFTSDELSRTRVRNENSDLPKALSQLKQKNWALSLFQHWQVGERAAWQQLDRFVASALADYDFERDFPALSATSQLSISFHFGHINPTAVYFYLLALIESGELKHSDVQPWVRQLIWRDYARYLLNWFPEKERQPFNDKYRLMEWSQDQKKLNRWQKGQTGIPIIDAGMRELWNTGSMHNRVRMLVASFLTKNLNIDWRFGLDWFGDTLFDADPANNSMGWQWVAGCGVDAAPYYRLFNPVVQSKKFDVEGHYIKKWLPELSLLDNKSIHEPWLYPEQCKLKGLELGRDYPLPVVSLKDSRAEHLQRVEYIKLSASA